jgi:hypothetical protein
MRGKDRVGIIFHCDYIEIQTFEAVEDPVKESRVSRRMKRELCHNY